MRLPLLLALLLAGAASAQEAAPPAEGDTISAVQKKPLQQKRRLELTPYGSMSLGDPYLQRWGGGLRAMWHFREGLSLGLDARGFGTWATQELVIARRELHAQVIESRERGSVKAMASIAPLYGKVALPGDVLVHFETFADAGLGGAWTETDAGHGIRPMLGAGLGQRVFLTQDLALTARVGGDLYAERVLVNGQTQTKALGFWTLGLGLSFYFGGAR